MLGAPSYGIAEDSSRQTLWNQAVQWAKKNSPWRSREGYEIGGSRSWWDEHGWNAVQARYEELGGTGRLAGDVEDNFFANHLSYNP